MHWTGRPGDDLLSVLRVEEILGAALPVKARGVDDQDLLLALRRLRTAERQDGRRQAGSIEDVGSEPNHGQAFEDVEDRAKAVGLEEIEKEDWMT